MCAWRVPAAIVTGRSHPSLIHHVEIKSPELGLVLGHPDWYGLGVGVVHGHYGLVIGYHRESCSIVPYRYILLAKIPLSTARDSPSTLP